MCPSENFFNPNSLSSKFWYKCQENDRQVGRWKTRMDGWMDRYLPFKWAPVTHFKGDFRRLHFLHLLYPKASAKLWHKELLDFNIPLTETSGPVSDQIVLCLHCWGPIPHSPASCNSPSFLWTPMPSFFLLFLIVPSIYSCVLVFLF